MLKLTQVTDTFPSVQIPSASGGLPVEVSLIAQMGHGAGNQLFASVAQRQQQHPAYIDELDEPSATLGATNFDMGDATALYSFGVGPKGHPFHRHAGHRIFTAVSGSGGAQLRFSSASDADIQQDPQNFVRALQFVNIPPDSLFTVRFGGETWHQFAPLTPNNKHPAFFALSCHTNELGGKLSAQLKEMVLNNESSIPALTELLPGAVSDLLQSATFHASAIPVASLSLDAPPGTLHRVMCNAVRGCAGMLRGAWASWRRAAGYLSYGGEGRKVKELAAPPLDSLLLDQLVGQRIHHDDTFCVRITHTGHGGGSAEAMLSRVLEGFMRNPPSGVSNLMALRNVLVKPLGLRTSPLGCPVSSLLSPDTRHLFGNRFPVLAQRTCAQGTQAEVILGADDKHLQFRSCVTVTVVDPHHMDVMLGTRVHCKNLFGRFYMAAIDLAHRRYVTPTMLRLAVEYAVGQERTASAPVQLANAT